MKSFEKYKSDKEEDFENKITNFVKIDSNLINIFRAHPKHENIYLTGKVG